MSLIEEQPKQAEQQLQQERVLSLLRVLYAEEFFALPQEEVGPTALNGVRVLLGERSEPVSGEVEVASTSMLVKHLENEHAAAVAKGLRLSRIVDLLAANTKLEVLTLHACANHVDIMRRDDQ